MNWRQQDKLDKAYNAGQRAWAENKPRMSNPFREKQRDEQKQWYAGYDNQRQLMMQQNLRGIGKY